MNEQEKQQSNEHAEWLATLPRPDHSQLEEELLTFTGKPGEKSPNVLDAMVYALTELFINRTSNPQIRSFD